MSIERFSLDGKVAIVTGGAGGCGEEYGRGLSAAGAQPSCSPISTVTAPSRAP